MVVVCVFAWLRPGRNAGLAGKRTVSYLAAVIITFVWFGLTARAYCEMQQQSKTVYCDKRLFSNDGRLFC